MDREDQQNTTPPVQVELEETAPLNPMESHETEPGSVPPPAESHSGEESGAGIPVDAGTEAPIDPAALQRALAGAKLPGQPVQSEPSPDPFPLFSNQELKNLADSTGDDRFTEVLTSRTKAEARPRQAGGDAANDLAAQLPYDVLALQENDWLRTALSTKQVDHPHLVALNAQIDLLQAQGMTGPMVKYNAAKLVSADIRRETVMENGRERRADHATRSFGTPSRRSPGERQRQEQGEATELTGAAKTLQDNWGITDPGAKADLKDGLKQAGRKLARRG